MEQNRMELFGNFTTKQNKIHIPLFGTSGMHDNFFIPILPLKNIIQILTLIKLSKLNRHDKNYLNLSAANNTNYTCKNKTTLII